MTPDNSDLDVTAALTALSAAAQGSPMVVRPAIEGKPAEQHDADARNAKVARLKAEYQAGRLNVDGAKLASKLVDAHVDKKPPLLP